MTAHAHEADLEDRSSESGRQTPMCWHRHGAPWRHRGPRISACLVAAGLVCAGAPVLSQHVADQSLVLDPIPGSYGSVLVDDDGHGDDSTLAAELQDDGVAGGDAGMVSDSPSCVDGRSTLADVMAWGSSPGWSEHGRCGPGNTCGPSSNPGYGDPCLDAGGSWCDPCHCGPQPGCLWAIQAEALVLWRNNFDGQPLLASSDGDVALDAGDVRTAAAAGPRIGVLRSLGCGRAIEGNYFNVGGIQGRTSTDGINAPYTPIRLADLAFTDIESATYTTRGQIKSAELNYRWCDGGRIIWLAGFRWIEWNEVAAVDMQADTVGAGGNDIRTTTGNDLYGGQFGCRFRFWDLGKWQMAAVGKAGVYGNTAYQRTTILVDSVPEGPLAADDTAVAFFGEVGINSTIWLNRWLAWRLGYNFFWLQGVATAAEQFPLNNFGSDTASIDSNDAVFLQGFSTGLEARW